MKIAKFKKVFFLILENNCFQGHESHQLSTYIRSIYFSMKIQRNRLILQEISYGLLDKVRTTVKDKIKKFN